MHCVVNGEDCVGVYRWDVVVNVSWLVKAVGFHGVVKYTGSSYCLQVTVSIAVRGVALAGGGYVVDDSCCVVV